MADHLKQIWAVFVQRLVLMRSKYFFPPGFFKYLVFQTWVIMVTCISCTTRRQLVLVLYWTSQRGARCECKCVKRTNSSSIVYQMGLRTIIHNEDKYFDHWKYIQQRHVMSFKQILQIVISRSCTNDSVQKLKKYLLLKQYFQCSTRLRSLRSPIVSDWKTSIFHEFTSSRIHNISYIRELV